MCRRIDVAGGRTDGAGPDRPDGMCRFRAPDGMRGRTPGGMRGIAVMALLAAACGPSAPAVAQDAATERARQIREVCRSANGADEKAACYDAELQPIARSGEVGFALDVLTGLSTLDSDVERDGHMFAHAIGIAAYSSERGFGETFASCRELFHAGCYHGVIQARFAAEGGADAETVNTLCAEVADAGADRWTRFQCVHGLGHGLLILHGHDLLKGLESCDLLRDGWERESCYGGAFMENVTNATHPHHAALTSQLGGHGGHEAHGDHGQTAFKAIDPDDPYYPCTVVKEHQKLACWGMQTSAILYLNGSDFAAAAKTCDGAPEPYRRTCHQSLGRDASGFANRDAAALVGICEEDTSELAAWCYVGAVKAVIDWAGRPTDGLHFCEAVRGEENRARCYEAVGEQIAVMVPGEAARREACAPAAADHVETCLWGAGLIDEMPPTLRRHVTGRS